MLLRSCPDQVQARFQGIFTNIQQRCMMLIFKRVDAAQVNQWRLDRTKRIPGRLAIDFHRSLHRHFLVYSQPELGLNLGGAAIHQQKK